MRRGGRTTASVKPSPEELRKDVGRTGGGFKHAIDALVDAGYQRGFAQGWRSSRTVAAVEAALFPNKAAARKGFLANQHLVPSWFLPLPVEELGDEAVSSTSDLGAIYMWRRDNVVLAASILRGGGPIFDYDAAAPLTPTSSTSRRQPIRHTRWHWRVNVVGRTPWATVR